MRHAGIGCLSLLLFAAPANAEWLEASSDHFVIYGEEREETLRGFGERLEIYHAAMARLFGYRVTKPSPSNRLTIYVVSRRAQVGDLAGLDNRYLTGFYVPRAGSPTAVIPELKGASSRFEISAETVLLHEYAHHFMAYLTARSFPRWFVEGFAEFFSGVRFKPDGSIGLGTPPLHRAAELAYAPRVPMRRLLEFDGGTDVSRAGNDAFYGQSWLLFHYLQMAPERAGQLATYQRSLASGESALEAAEGAFGDLEAPAREMETYRNRRKLSVLVVDRQTLSVAPVAVRRLREAEAAILPLSMQARIGGTADEVARLVPEVRKVAAAHPRDPVVLAALAEAEADAGHYDEAIVAAESALGIDPKQVNASIQKAYAMSRKKASGAMAGGTWDEVRSQCVASSRIEPGHPVPLALYYLTYLEAGEPPPLTAILNLERAMELAPFDASLRFAAAQQMSNDGRLAEAMQTLAPLAYSPHRGELTEQSRQLLEDLAKRAGAGQRPAAAPNRPD